MDPTQADWGSMTVAVLGEHIISFICFEMLRGMSPLSVVNVYLPHIENYWAELGVDIKFCEARKCKRVKLVAKGVMNAYFKKHPKSGRVKVVFSLPMTDAVPIFLRHDHVCIQQLFRLAMRLGIWFLLRKGEYLKTHKNKGGLRRDCLVFSSPSGAHIPYTMIGKTVASALHVNVKFSKTDPHGYGRLVSHQRQPPGASCVVSEIENFIAKTRDLWHVKETQALFVWPDGSDLLADDVAMVMKGVAGLLGTDPKKVSVHSLRFGGASLLASFGLPQYLIEYFGGWKADSKTLPLYTRPDSSSLGIASACFGRFKADGEIGARLAQLGVQ